MIYIVLPIFNEENNILTIIAEVRELMRSKNFKIIAINDGSTDKSPIILDELTGHDLVVEHFPVNRGIGAVFLTAIKRVSSESNNDDDVMIIMEGDQTSDCALVGSMIGSIKNNGKDIVIASRYQKGGQYRNFPVSRRILSCCANSLLRLLFPITKEVKDYSIFLRAYRVGILRRLGDHFGHSEILRSRGFAANPELLIKLSLFTDRIEEIPFIYDYGKKTGKSKLNILRTIKEYIVLMVHLRPVMDTGLNSSRENTVKSDRR